jgi:hypothetical protein
MRQETYGKNADRIIPLADEAADQDGCQQQKNHWILGGMSAGLGHQRTLHHGDQCRKGNTPVSYRVW